MGENHLVIYQFDQPHAAAQAFVSASRMPSGDFFDRDEERTLD